jgi:hypothetical protein
MRLFRWYGVFTILTILFSSCTPVNTLTGVDESLLQPAPANPLIPIRVQAMQQVVTSDEPNECLKCHSDKDRLIETADPVIATAKSESKGVG